MKFDGWIGPYKVGIFPWIDGERIYVNVQRHAYGRSIEHPPIWDKTIFITDDEAGQWLLSNYLHSFIEHIANMQIRDNTEVTLTASPVSMAFHRRLFGMSPGGL